MVVFVWVFVLVLVFARACRQLGGITYVFMSVRTTNTHSVRAKPCAHAHARTHTHIHASELQLGDHHDIIRLCDERVPITPEHDASARAPESEKRGHVLVRSFVVRSFGCFR